MSEFVKGLLWGDGGGKITPPPCLKLDRVMLETWNLAHKYTLMCSLRKYTFKYQGPLNFADVRIFLVPSLKAIVWELC